MVKSIEKLENDKKEFECFIAGKKRQGKDDSGRTPAIQVGTM